MEKMSAAPAAKKTLPAVKENEKIEAFNAYKPLNADKIDMMKAAMKTKFKK
jgi:hypothetical protein